MIISIDSINKYYKQCEKNMIKFIDFNYGSYKYNFKKGKNNEFIVEVFDKDKNKNILEAPYEIIGSFDKNINIWYWSWAIPFCDTSSYIKIKSIIDKTKKNLENENNINLELEEFHFYFNNQYFYCDKQSLQCIIKLCLILSNGIWIFPIDKKIGDNTITEYIIIYDIFKVL